MLWHIHLLLSVSVSGIGKSASLSVRVQFVSTLYFWNTRSQFSIFSHKCSAYSAWSALGTWREDTWQKTSVITASEGNAECVCSLCFILENPRRYAQMWLRKQGKETKSDVSNMQLGFCLAPTLYSAPTLWRQQASHPASVFLIPSDVGKLFASQLWILTLSISLKGLDCFVIVISNTCGTDQDKTDEHTHTRWGRRQPEPRWTF